MMECLLTFSAFFCFVFVQNVFVAALDTRIHIDPATFNNTNPSPLEKKANELEKEFTQLGVAVPEVNFITYFLKKGLQAAKVFGYILSEVARVIKYKKMELVSHLIQFTETALKIMSDSGANTIKTLNDNGAKLVYASVDTGRTAARRATEAIGSLTSMLDLFTGSVNSLKKLLQEMNNMLNGRTDALAE